MSKITENQRNTDNEITSYWQRFQRPTTPNVDENEICVLLQICW